MYSIRTSSSNPSSSMTFLAIQGFMTAICEGVRLCQYDVRGSRCPGIGQQPSSERVTASSPRPCACRPVDGVQSVNSLSAAEAPGIAAHLCVERGRELGLAHQGGLLVLEARVLVEAGAAEEVAGHSVQCSSPLDSDWSAERE